MWRVDEAIDDARLERQRSAVGDCPSDELEVFAACAEGLVWRVDEATVDATMERQRAAIEELPRLLRRSLPEARLRACVLGSPEV